MRERDSERNRERERELESERQRERELNKIERVKDLWKEAKKEKTTHATIIAGSLTERFRFLGNPICQK